MLLPLLLCGVVAPLLLLLWLFVPHPIIFIAIGLLPIAILVVLHQPFLFVLLFVIFSFFRIHEVFPQLYNFKIPLLLSLASLGALTWHVAISRKLRVYWSAEFTTISIFFILVIAGVLLASNRPIAIEYFKGIYWKIILMTFAIAWLSRTEKDFALASRLITFFGLLVGAVALANQVNGVGLVEGTRVTIGRDIGSVLGDPNDLALVLMFPVAFACSLIITPNIGTYSKCLGWLSAIILFLAIIATQSRGGLLGMMAIFAVFGYRRIQSKTLFICLGIIVAIALFVFAGISDRASGGAAEAGIDASAMGRLYAWEAAFGMAVHNPLSGVGINNFYSNYYYYSPHWDGLNHAVHSTWFGVLAETGFLGLIVFVLCIYSLVRTSMRSLNDIEAQIKHSTNKEGAVKRVAADIHASAQAVFAGLIGTIVSATFLTQGFTWPIYILAAFVIAIAQYNAQHLTMTKRTN
ncbi:oligosaccharide repeat unit polymerase [Psychromonas sp. psych-6C06]|uniref:O-antigen ligase family protein n=1 Tax=Psychromonas sp. psych-6C06 TaxID=2058089 RepID=UPI000C34A482|nr:O-antigen ligase family protein [Psychromonas sp. psych-6C06]PKF62472.1 oligosaccharide repeat unit polymerase [Psychromonas sp. psych-6C06]